MSEQGLISAIEELAATPVVTGFPCSVGEFLKQISDKGVSYTHLTLPTNREV